MPIGNSIDVDDGAAARREFLKKCGKFAAVTPPVITLLLSGTATPALAVSGAGSNAGAGAGAGGG